MNQQTRETIRLLTTENAALRKRLRVVEEELAALKPPSTLERMIDEGYIDDTPGEWYPSWSGG